MESATAIGTVGRVTLDADATQTPTGVTVPHCPVCAAELRLGRSDSFDSWSCPNGHGLAMTLSESYERLQEDEIGAIWQQARASGPGPLASPFDGRPMVRVRVEVDTDEVPDTQPGDGPATAAVVVDVDVENQFIWLDAGELGVFPADVEDPAPSPEVLDKEREIIEQFGNDLTDAAERREGRELSERLFRRVARHPGALRALDDIGRGITAY